MTAGKAIYSLLTNGTAGAITTEVAPIHVDQFNDTTGPAYIRYSVESVQPYDTKSGASTIDEETYNLILFSKDEGVLLSLASAVRADLDRLPRQTVAGISLDGVQYLDTGNVGFDDKTERFDVEMRFKLRVKR